MYIYITHKDWKVAAGKTEVKNQQVKNLKHFTKQEKQKNITDADKSWVEIKKNIKHMRNWKKNE